MDLGHSPDTGASEGELRSGYALTPSPSHSKNISLFTERRTSERAVSKDGYSSFLFNPLWGFPVVAAGILFVVDQQTLETARILDARGLATCLKSDADNVLVTLSARGLHEGIVITARAEMEETERKLLRASELPRALGRTLDDLKLPTRTGLTVVVVVHGDGRRLFNPPPSFRIESDDELVVIGPPEGVSAMLEELGE